ncbi:MAG: hypothetical protein GYB65_16515 [Chloroflexi bacterium]|nr:hypothetical protein [Chloroflexota bacterium]
MHTSTTPVAAQLRHVGLALWGAAIAAVGVFLAQTALAESESLTPRLLLMVGATVIAALGVMGLAHIPYRQVLGAAPEPVSLMLAGLAGLGAWAGSRWVTAVLDRGLADAAGELDMPTTLAGLSDSVLGIDTQSAAYEVFVLLGVVVIPLAQAWLLWGLVQPAVTRVWGRWRAAWVTGVVAGVVLTLMAVQNVTLQTPTGLGVIGGRIGVLDIIVPALPWGLAALGGYLVIGWIAALCVALADSPWAGFTAHSTYAYASFALRDELAEELGGKRLLDVAWLTVLLLTGFATLVVLQVLRYRNERSEGGDAVENDSAPDSISWVVWIGLPFALLLAGVVALVVVDLQARG